MSTTVLIYLKNMSDELLPLEVRPDMGLLGLRQALFRLDPKVYPLPSIRLFRGSDTEEQKHDDVLPFVEGEIIHLRIVQSEYILNLTQGTYFEYYPLDAYGQYGYQTILGRLTSRVTPADAVLPADIGSRHWTSDDKIVFVPDHLKAYVAYAYARIRA